jgi:hypothetical protein
MAQNKADQLNTYLLDKQAFDKDSINLHTHTSPLRENLKSQTTQSSIITKKKKLRVIQHRKFDKIKSRAEYKDEIFTKPLPKNNEY